MIWHESTLGEECELYQPQTLAKNELDNSGIYKVYGANGVIGTHSKFNHESPQLLVTCRGATCGTINISEEKSWINGNAMVVKPRNANIDLYFLSHYLHNLDISKAITGAAQPQITRQSLAPIKIKFPPVAEQKLIAAILDKATDIKAKRELAIAKLDELAQSIFVEMFGDVESLINRGEATYLSNVVAKDKIVTYGIVQAGPHVNDGIPYIKTGDIKRGEIVDIRKLARTSKEIANSYARSAISENDIVMSIRATVGTTALVPASLHGANLTQGTARISPGNMVLPVYLLNYLRTNAVQRWIQKQVKGATFREITLGKLRELPVYVPKIEHQKEYSVAIAQIEKLKKAYEATENLTLDLTASLQDQAFTTGFNA